MNNTIHKPIAITTNLFQLGLPSFPVYLSIGEEGMLIEGGTGPTTDMIVQQIQMLGIDPSKIKYIALTTHPYGPCGLCSSPKATMAPLKNNIWSDRCEIPKKRQIYQGFSK